MLLGFTFLYFLCTHIRLYCSLLFYVHTYTHTHTHTHTHACARVYPRYNMIVHNISKILIMVMYNIYTHTHTHTHTYTHIPLLTNKGYLRKGTYLIIWVVG